MIGITDRIEDSAGMASGIVAKIGDTLQKRGADDNGLAIAGIVFTGIGIVVTVVDIIVNLVSIRNRPGYNGFGGVTF